MLAATKWAVALAGLAMAPIAHAQGGPDELWNMNTRMEMAGMPGQTMNQQVCMEKGETRPERMQQDPNCKVTEQRRTGNKMTWKVVCSGRDPMTGTGEMTRTGDTLNGRMRMQGKSGGEAVDMTIVYSGTRAGACNAKEQRAAAQAQVAAMQAQGEAQMAQMCRDSIRKYATSLFEMQGTPCAAYAGEFCTHVKKTAQSMRTPAGYRKAMQAEGMQGGGWERAAQHCQMDTASTQAAACQSAMGGRDWQFIADFCPAETKALATEHCAGRDYTTAMSSEYKVVCQQYASAGGGFAGRAPRSQPAAQSPPQQGSGDGSAGAPSPADVVKEGANQLRRLFGR
jgi:hypothetical protein